MKFGARQGRATNNSPHDLARQLSAQRLSLPLPAAEATWLASHLRRCPACARIDGAYVADRELLKRLVAPEPPRDLFARTSVALDRAEREQSNREVAGPPLPGAAQGRSGGRRSTRSIRADRSGAALRSAALGTSASGGRPGAATTADQRWLVPFAGLAAAALVVVIGGTALLTQSFAPIGLVSRAGASDGAGDGSLGVTPIPVGAADVAWLSPVSDGTYTLNSARVDRVCAPTGAAACAPFDGSEARQIPNLKTKPRAVLKSPSRQQLVVVEAGTGSSGSSVYVMSVPAAITPASPTAGAGAADASIHPDASATARPSAAAPASPPATASSGAPAATDAPGSPDSSSGPDASPTPTPDASASPEATSAPAASDGAAAGSPVTPGTPEPTAAATLAIISDVIVMGETAAYSPDGTMLAFSARPVDGSHGPDIYLWRVGDPEARPVTSDHASMFSGWWGTKLIGSRAIPQAQDASAGGGPTATPAPSEAATSEPATSEPAPSEAAASPATDEGGSGVGGTGTGTSPEPSPSASGQSGTSSIGTSALARTARLDQKGSSATPPAASSAPRPTPSSSGSNPAGKASPLAASPDPSPSATARPDTSPRRTPEVTPGASNSPDPSPAATTPAPASQPEAIPQSFLIDTADGSETPITSVSAWRPVVDPTGRFVVYWSGRLRYDAATLSWVPGTGQLLLASWPAFSRSDPAAILAPTQLLSDDPDGAPSGDWDIRWDETGGHLAIWIADPQDPTIGRLSLLTIDPTTAMTIPAQILLHDAPAQAGFSLVNERLAWATPPGPDGTGSRLQVLAWTGANAGKIDSQPASDGGAVIVVR